MHALGKHTVMPANVEGSDSVRHYPHRPAQRGALLMYQPDQAGKILMDRDEGTFSFTAQDRVYLNTYIRPRSQTLLNLVSGF